MDNSVSNSCSVILKKTKISVIIHNQTSNFENQLVKNDFCTATNIFSVHNHVGKKIDHFYKTVYVGEINLLKFITH